MDESHSKLQFAHNYYTTKGLNQGDKVIAEYVWIDSTDLNMRTKTKVMDKKVSSLDDLDEWDFDGSSCGMAETKSSEVILKPVYYCPDPFRGGDNILVLCSTYITDDESGNLRPTLTNFRHYAEKIFEGSETVEPMFGIEQEYTLFEQISAFKKWPLGWPEGGYPAAQGPYYCGAGADVCFGRVIMEKHMKACLTAGIKIGGTNAEVLPGSWEYQIGPSNGLDVGDHLWMSRYILTRVCEDLGIGLSFEPKPVKGDWNGSACHTNFSTKEMRDSKEDGPIEEAIKKLEKAHDRHIKMYGEGNKDRLSGDHETARMDEFTWGKGKAISQKHKLL